MNDTEFMELALSMARKAARFGEVPVGAVVTRKGAIVARAHNLTRTFRDPTAHAELLAIRRAAAVLGDWRLTGCTLYCTVEPCLQCAGAMILSRISRLVFGCRDPKMGAVVSLYHLGSDGRLNHQFEITEGVLRDVAEGLMKDFFRTLRGKRPFSEKKAPSADPKMAG